jgi:hypothetical protein
MVFRPTTEPLPEALIQRSREALQPLAGLNAYDQIEITCRHLIGLLATARTEFEDTEEHQEDFDALCDSVEDWLDVELDRLRFLPRR